MIPAGCVERCPACPHRELSAERSLEEKTAWLRRELAPWSQAIRPPSSPARRWGYRGKALLHARLLGGRWVFGLLRRMGREEELVPIPDCPLHEPSVNTRFRLAERFLPASLPVAYGLASGQAFTLVLKSARNPAWVELLRGLEDGWPGSFFVNWNPVAGRRALDSRRTERIFGPEWMESGGVVHGPSSFRQQIPEMENAALVAAEDFLEGAGRRYIADLYCGIGAGLKRWEARGWEAAGVEISGEALAAARRNAPAAALFRGRVEDRLPQLNEFLGENPFVLYTNPPRSGHARKVLHWILARRPDRIAYLSCHPRSLAGDLAEIGPAYSVEGILPLDFFPQTSHLECLALLQRC